MNRTCFLLSLCLLPTAVLGQLHSDTLRTTQLSEVTVTERASQQDITRLAPIVGTYLFAGKKSEVISLRAVDANLADKTGRQLFAKVPGVFVYDMDGAGNQLNIATRGLDPHRGWEFNIRQDGVLVNSDLYAYPASHYSAPLESIERIELVRGTGSLQYGAQFGGLLNYVTKQADTTKHFAFESFTTVGSFRLVNTYNAVGGKIGKLRYYAYVAKKERGGYRKNEHTSYDAESVVLTYAATPTLSLRATWARSYYLYRSPGPLTDALFRADPTQATRARNYFSPTITVPSLRVDWALAPTTQLALTSSAVLGNRSSVLFDKPATVRDTLNPATGQFAPRQVDIDRFQSYTTELRLLQRYTIGQRTNHLAIGGQLIQNVLHRRQQGQGTTGSDYDLSLASPTWGRDVRLQTKNVALFAENQLTLSAKLSLTAGARYETGYSRLRGTIVYYPTEQLPVALRRNYVLLGSSFSYKIRPEREFYGGIAQTYRPMLFKDLIPVDAYEQVDPRLRDARGYNAELGFRGTYHGLTWDLTGFALRYNNRFGTLLQRDEAGAVYTYRTNIGNSLTSGVESFVQARWPLSRSASLTVFTSTTWMDGRYTRGTVKAGTTNRDIAGNRVESVPRLISRNGLTLHVHDVRVTALYSYTSKTYADALNTVAPSASGAVGIVPSYGLVDLNASWTVTRYLTMKASLNNVTDTQYFTKRPLFYPGPGIWPSEGRSGTLSFIVNIGR